MGIRSRLSRRRSRSPKPKRQGSLFGGKRSGGNTDETAEETDSNINTVDNVKQEETESTTQKTNFEDSVGIFEDDDSEDDGDEDDQADATAAEGGHKVDKRDSMALSLERLSQTINSLESQLGSSASAATVTNHGSQRKWPSMIEEEELYVDAVQEAAADAAKEDANKDDDESDISSEKGGNSAAVISVASSVKNRDNASAASLTLGDLQSSPKKPLADPKAASWPKSSSDKDDQHTMTPPLLEETAPLKSGNESGGTQRRGSSSESVLECLLENKPMADFEVSESNDGEGGSRENSTSSRPKLSAYDRSLNKQIRRASHAVMDQALNSMQPPPSRANSNATSTTINTALAAQEFEGKIADLARGLEEVRLSLFQVNEDVAYESMATRRNFENLNGSYKIMQDEHDKMHQERLQLLEMIQRQNDKIDQLEGQMEQAQRLQKRANMYAEKRKFYDAEVEQLRMEIEEMKQSNVQSYNEFQAIGHAIAEHINGFFRHLLAVVRGEERYQEGDFEDNVDATYNRRTQEEFKQADAVDSGRGGHVPPPNNTTNNTRTRSRLEEVAEQGFVSKRTSTRRMSYAGDVSLGGSFRGGGFTSGRSSFPSRSNSNLEDESSSGENDINSLTGGSNSFSPRKGWLKMHSRSPHQGGSTSQRASPGMNSAESPEDDIPDDSSQRDHIAGAMQRQRRSSLMGRMGAAMFQSDASPNTYPDDDHLNIMSRYIKEKTYGSDRSERSCRSGRSGRSGRSSSRKLPESVSLRSQRSDRSTKSNDSSRSDKSGGRLKAQPRKPRRELSTNDRIEESPWREKPALVARTPSDKPRPGPRRKGGTPNNAGTEEFRRTPTKSKSASDFVDPRRTPTKSKSASDFVEPRRTPTKSKSSDFSGDPPFRRTPTKSKSSGFENLGRSSSPKRWGSAPEANVRKKSGEFSSADYISPLERVRLAHGCSRTDLGLLDDGGSETTENLPPTAREKKRQSEQTVLTAEDLMGAMNNSEEDLSAVGRLNEFERSFGELRMEDEEELDGTQKLSNLTTQIVVVEHKPRGRRSSMVSELTGNFPGAGSGESGDSGSEAEPPAQVTGITIDKAPQQARPSRRCSIMSELSHGTAKGNEKRHANDAEWEGDTDSAPNTAEDPEEERESLEDLAESTAPTNISLGVEKASSFRSETSELSTSNRYPNSYDAANNQANDSSNSNRNQRSHTSSVDSEAALEADDSERFNNNMAKTVDDSKRRISGASGKGTQDVARRPNRSSVISISQDALNSPGGFNTPTRPEDLSLSVNLNRLNLRWGTTGDEELGVSIPDINGSFNQSAAWQRVSSILADESEASEGGDSLGALERKSSRDKHAARPERFKLSRMHELDSERSLLKETIKEENSDEDDTSTSRSTTRPGSDRGLGKVMGATTGRSESMSFGSIPLPPIRRQTSIDSHSQRSAQYDDLGDRWGYWKDAEPDESPLPSQSSFLSPAIARQKNGTAWGRMSALFIDESFSAEDEELNSINREVRLSSSLDTASVEQERGPPIPQKKRGWGIRKLLRPDSSPKQPKKSVEQKPAAHGAWRKAERIAKIAKV